MTLHALAPSQDNLTERRTSPIWLATASNDRGMQDLLRALPPDPARRAARDLVREQKPFIVCTGFPVNGTPETDGPPGAIALLNALRILGKPVQLASWAAALEIFTEIEPSLQVIEVPTGSDKTVRAVKGFALITVETCGQCLDGTYRNMNRIDVSNQAPRFEAVFGINSLASVGDGGNEFGMGSAPEWFFDKQQVRRPISKTRNLIPATVSNYGVYALIKELEWATKEKLLPNPGKHLELIRRLVAAGCVDGFTGEAKLAVDGRGLNETEALLLKLIDME